MTRLIVALWACIAAAALSACGSSTEPTAEEQQVKPPYECPNTGCPKQS